VNPTVRLQYDDLLVARLHQLSVVAADTVNTPVSTGSNAMAVAKEVGSVTWRLTQTLLKRLPDVSDPNPVKLAFGIAKLILDVKDVRRKPSSEH